MTRNKHIIVFSTVVSLVDAMGELTYAGMSEEEIESNIEGGNDEQNEDGEIVYTKASYIAYKFTQGIEARYSGKEQVFYLSNI